MLERWYPTAHVPSVFAIDYEKLAALGYKGILFDIDNTLVHHGDDSTPEVDALFRHIHSLGLKTLLLSDNSAVRIERFNRNIRTLFIAEAGKPDPAAYRRACAMLGLPPEQVICVGDQLFRDIRGANRAAAHEHGGRASGDYGERRDPQPRVQRFKRPHHSALWCRPRMSPARESAAALRSSGSDAAGAGSLWS